MKTQRLLSFLGIMLFSCIFLSCEKVISHEDNPYTYMYENGKLKRVANHLHFQSKDAFGEFLDSIGEDGKVITKAGDAGTPLPSWFTSLRDRDLALRATKAGDSDEMTREEYEIWCAQQLMSEPKFEYVMDTALVIGVGDYTYKITEEGTFAVPSEVSEEKMLSVVQSADREYLAGLEKGSVLELNDGIVFYRTFGEKEQMEDLFEQTDDEETKAGSYGLSNNLHAGYNTTTYNWSKQTLLGKFLEIIKIKDISQTVSLDSKHRLVVNMYNDNFGFWQVAGIKSMVQVKKSFLFIPIWKDDDTYYNTATGINYMYSQHKDYWPAPEFVSFEPAVFNTHGFNVVTGSFKNVGQVPFLYGKLKGVPYISDFGDKINFCLPKLGMDGKMLKKEMEPILEKLFDADPKELLSFTRTVAGKLGSANDPSFLFLPKGKGKSFTYNNSMLTGKKESRTIRQYLRFHNKGGFTDTGEGGWRADGSFRGSLSLPMPIQFNMYEINAIDAFVSVYYNKKWVGIRFVFEDKR